MSNVAFSQANIYNWGPGARRRDRRGRLPLAVAAERGVPWNSPFWNDGDCFQLPMVLRANLAAVQEVDVATGLSMFMLAAVGARSDLEAVFRLLVEYPILPVLK